MKQTFYDFCMVNNKTELLKQWDVEANGEVTPKDVSYGSGRKVWWRCEKGHIWQAVVNSRSNGSGCPVCSGKKAVRGSNDLASGFPMIAKQWHPTKNLPMTPDKVTCGSHRLAWWQCGQGHEWRATIKSRTAGNGCPVCAGRKLIPGVNDLAFVRPDLAAEWHPVKNGTLKPDLVLASTVRRVWWQCEKGHEWQARIKDRTVGTGCPVCSGRKVVAGINDLASGYPMLIKEWHPFRNGSLTPQEVSGLSNRRVWWKCEKGHEWQTSVYARTQEKTGCPYCTNRKVLAGFNDLATLRPKLAKQWHPDMNGSLTPEQVTVGSGKKVWWLCPDGHVWKTAVYVRAGAQNSGCPVCAGNVKRKRL